MGKKLYVGNISYQTSETDLEGLFAPFGSVESVKIIMDRDTGRSKGFGFVEMDNSESAQKAIQSLDGSEVSGRNLKVNEAIDKPRDNNRNHGGGGGNRW